MVDVERLAEVRMNITSRIQECRDVFEQLNYTNDFIIRNEYIMDYTDFDLEEMDAESLTNTEEIADALLEELEELLEYQLEDEEALEEME